MSSMDTILNHPNYNELKDIYYRYFSLRGIAGEIDNKFALISLIGFLTHQARMKTPDATCYQVIRKVTDGKLNLPDELINGLAIVCEDFMAGSTKYNACGCKSAKEMIDQINVILEKWLPF